MDEGSVFEWFACLGDNITADGDAKQSEYDLKAQQDMAAWAFGMLIVTIWIAVITLLGVLFVWRTLAATRDTVEATKEIGRDQSRAYLHVKSVRWLEDNESSEFTVFIENSGATPAKRFEVFAECLVKDTKCDLPTRITPVEMKGWNGLPGKEVFQMGVIPKFVPNEQAIFDRDTLVTYLIFRGVIRYTTIFSETYESEFSFMGRGRGANQPKYEKYGSLGTKMSRTPEVMRVFEPLK